MMQMTKKECIDYKTIRPKNQKFTLIDLAKYVNAADMLPHYVSWGGEVNAAHFHNNMIKLWETDPNKFNELYYKELIAKKIIFSSIEKIISDQEWYQEKRAYRPQLVAYTFSKLVYEIKKINLMINYRQIWEKQNVPCEFVNTIARIGKLVFDSIYDESRSTANIETYCKKQECWEVIKKKDFNIPDELIEILISFTEKKVDDARARKDQKLHTGIENELTIYQKGNKYWLNLLDRANAQELLSLAEVDMLKAAINYCNGKYMQLSKKQVQEIIRIENNLKNYFPDVW